MIPRVNILERDAPPEVKALMDAYREATGLPVTMTHDRCHALQQITSRCEPPLGPADIKAVVAVIKKDLAGQRPRFTQASLEFRNLMGDADTFEERALACRQLAERRRGRAAAAARTEPVAQSRTLPDGSTVSVLAPGRPDREVTPADAAAALRSIADNLHPKR